MMMEKTTNSAQPRWLLHPKTKNMKKLKFNEKSLDALKSNEVSNIASIVGGQKYASTWSSSNGSHGTDTVHWGTGETQDYMLNSESSPCLYCDITWNSIKPTGHTVTRFAEFTCYDTF